MPPEMILGWHFFVIERGDVHMTLRKRSSIKTSIFMKKYLIISCVGSILGLPISAADKPASYLNTQQGWNPQTLSENAVSKSLRDGQKPDEQLLWRVRGVPTPPMVLNQNESHDTGWFPSQPATMMPYLDSTYTFGNTCIRPNAWIDSTPWDTGMQRIKTAASKVGLQYTWHHGINYTGLNGSSDLHGQRDFAAFNSSLITNWFFYRSANKKNGWFISVEWEYGQGMNYNQRHEGASQSLGSLSNPMGSSRGGGSALGNVSLAYTCLDGELLFMVGQLDTTNYLDHNAYANFGFNNLLNTSFINNPVVPLTYASWGYHVAWQPTKSFYAMIASAANNTLPNHNPFNGISSSYWTNNVELGWITENLAGIGPGTYRLQPFATNYNDESGAGLGINLQQQLGKYSNLGLFLRGGFANEKAAQITGAKRAIAFGFVWMNPYVGRGAGNEGQAAAGFFCQEPADSQKPYSNKKEFGWEFSYVAQVTPTMTLQPDFQIIRNPVHGKPGETNYVFQIQNTWHW